MLADEAGDGFFFVIEGVFCGILAVGFVGLAEGDADGLGHLAFLGAVGFIDEEGDAEGFKLGGVFELVEDPGEFLLGGDDDGFALTEEAGEVFGFVGQADDVFEMGEFLDVVADVFVEGAAVGEDENYIHQLLIVDGVVEAVEAVGKPADGEGFAAAGGVVDEDFAPDVPGGGEVGKDVIGEAAHHAALVVAGEDGEGRAGRFVSIGILFGDADEEEGEGFEEVVGGENFAVEEFDGVFTWREGGVGEAGVVPAEVFGAAGVCRGHDIGGVGGDVHEGVLEDFAGVIAGGELGNGVVNGLVGFVFEFDGNDGEAVEVDDEVNLLMVGAKVEMMAEGEAVEGVKGGGGAVGGAGFGVVEFELEAANLEAVAEDHPKGRDFEFAMEGAEEFGAGVGAVEVGEFAELVGLGGGDEGPEVILGDEVERVGDFGLVEGGVAVPGVEVGSDVVLEGDFGRGGAGGHGPVLSAFAKYAGYRLR